MSAHRYQLDNECNLAPLVGFGLLASGVGVGEGNQSAPIAGGIMQWEYKYRCSVVGIVDGDTIDLSFDLGMGVTITKRCRLYGIDAPEVRGDNKAMGYLSRRCLGEMLKDKKNIWVKTHKDRTGKYGRYLVELYTDESETSLNMMRVERGLAKESKS